jgi:tetratricopeptide (TPR) repeat protein
MVLALTLIAGGLTTLVLSRPAPDFGTPLRVAEKQLEDGEYKTAIDTLNNDFFPFIDDARLSAEHRRDFHLMMARGLYLAQKKEGLDVEKNHRNILDSYREAEAFKAELVPRDIYFLAMTHLALGQLPQALRRADSLPKEEAERRLDVVREVIAHAMDPKHPDDGLALELLTRLLTDPGVPREERVWAIARQAELRLSKGFAEDAINRLLRELPMLEGADQRRVGELCLLLGRAYFETGAFPEAEKQLDRAERMLPESDGAIGKLRVMQGRILAGRGQHAEAKERFEQAIGADQSAAIRLPSLLGIAEAHAAEGETEEAIGVFVELVEELKRGEASRDVPPMKVIASLLARYQDRMEASDTGNALRLVSLAERLSPEGDVPADVLLALATVQRTLASEVMNPGGEGSIRTLAEMDPSTRAEAKSHLLAAGSYYQEHAGKMLLAVDDAAYASSLWSAGEAFDMAGDQEAAIRVFTQYGQRPGDSRQSEAKFRLAQAHQARGDLEPAAELYRGLIKARDARGGGAAAGRFADGSYVPLAQTYLLQGGSEHVAEAERLLLSVVGGAVFSGTDAPGYREALVELANLYYRSGEHERAIERFEAVLARYPSDSRAPGSRFRLADSYRMSALGVEEKLGAGAMPDGERRGLEAIRRERLMQALTLFERVRADLESRDGRRLSELDEVFLRNAYYYVADCAFKLGDYEAAIRHFDAARERYPRDPASLVAMVQIVNSYVKLGDMRRASVANEKAIRFYKSLPESVWNDPNLPMTRADWERWLDSADALGLLTGGRTASASTPEN